ncbi:MAG TPA: GntR family transcriptional regulator [Firmicutes bacterium]|nr:GntR family transcriptional regulator [Bacillota bacterium]
MQIEIQRKSGVPLYLQVKRQIERLVRMGLWEKGKKLPTERELAKALRVSRNTISTAYKELEDEGVLYSHQGRGTFVAETDFSVPGQSRKERLLQMIDLAIDETLNLGFSLEEFVSLVKARAEEKKELLQHIKVGFVECNREQLDYFSKELELGAGAKIVPVLLSEYRHSPPEVNLRLRDADLVVTTFFHLNEVRELVNDRRKEVLGIALVAQMETMVKIARLPKGKRVGLICISEPFAERVVKSIANAGISELDIVTTTVRNEDRLRAFLAEVDAVIVSPGRKREIESLLPREMEVIEFIYRPDTGSVNLLESVLLERRQEKVN